MVGFVRLAVAAAFGDLTQVPFLGWALGVLIVVGCFLAWRRRPREELRRVAAAPAALLVGAFLFLVIAGMGRGSESAQASRYSGVFATLALPAIAVAADAVIVRWRRTGPVFVVALLSRWWGTSDSSRPAPWSPRAPDPTSSRRTAGNSSPHLGSGSPRRSHRGLHFDLAFAPSVSFGWMRDGVASGRFPRPGHIDPIDEATSELQLALRKRFRHHPRQCTTMLAPTRVRLEAGSSITAPGALAATYTDATGTRSRPVGFVLGSVPAVGPASLVAYAGPLDLEITTKPAGGRFELCDPNGAPFAVQGGP